MGWNISAEVIAFIIVLIISVYSGKSHTLPSTKNRVFRVCLVTTLGAIGSNLASTIMIAYAPLELAPATWFVTMLYFILTPLLGTAYYYYAIAVISEARPIRRSLLIISAIPCLLYAGCVIANIATGCLFYLDEAGGYHQGPLIATTYFVFYFYCLVCFAVVVFTRAPIDRVIKRILAIFPLVAVMVIAVQQLFPSYLLSGSAAACSLLIIYLYLQNKRLSVDSLTNLSNQQEFRLMTSLLHEKQNAFTAIIISLSNFKFINDKFGHESGDEFLRDFSQYLEEQSQGTHLYRYGGDEFVYIVDEVAQHKHTSRSGSLSSDALITKLQKRLEDAWNIADNPYMITTAIGVVSYPTIAKNPSDVVAALEYSTTQAKKLEANTPCFCTADMMSAIHRRNVIADVLRGAVQQEKFVVHFQPIWWQEEQRFISAEALCRLTDDELGPIPPDVFIPIAEQTGLISDITRLVLEQSCDFISSFRTAHPDSAFRGVSVNFSPIQFIQIDLADTVLDIVSRYNIPASCLRIEITESALISNPEAVNTFMTQMHAHGVSFYLDDFGTGYSNLSSMLNLPFDVIKLDKSILRSASVDEGRFKLLCDLVSGFKAVGRLVLAEGVETEEQQNQLNEAQCDFRQGYLYSRPLPADEVVKVIVASEDAH